MIISNAGFIIAWLVHIGADLVGLKLWGILGLIAVDLCVTALAYWLGMLGV